MDLETAVKERYTAAAKAPEAGLCCPVQYDTTYLAAIPEEVIERDYGCGDPVRHVNEGEVVLDLGSGAGKVCFIAAQLTGAHGRVIGVDTNPTMLDIARRNAPIVAERVGFANVEFHRASIDDLALDRDAADGVVAGAPVTDVEALLDIERSLDDLRRNRPLIAAGSVDVVLSNCVLNLITPERKPAMFAEIARVLRPGGRAVISDIVTDRDVPEHLRRDPELWSGCYSGALREDRFLGAFEEVGLRGAVIVERRAHWETIEGITFRSVTVIAHKDAEPADPPVPVLYVGPYRRVEDDAGLALERGRVSLVPASVAARMAAGGYGALLEADGTAAGVAAAVAPVGSCSTSSGCC